MKVSPLEGSSGEVHFRQASDAALKAYLPPSTTCSVTGLIRFWIAIFVATFPATVWQLQREIKVSVIISQCFIFKTLETKGKDMTNNYHRRQIYPDKNLDFLNALRCPRTCS
tara:strand:- start:46 stop:381 length:336 start_codon:yes stop_codon:yes gene_type:complete